MNPVEAWEDRAARCEHPTAEWRAPWPNAPSELVEWCPNCPDCGQWVGRYHWSLDVAAYTGGVA